MRIIHQSSTEQVVLPRNSLLPAYDSNVSHPLEIENQSAFKMAANNGPTELCKAIRIEEYYLRIQCRKASIQPLHKPSQAMMADIST